MLLRATIFSTVGSIGSLDGLDAETAQLAIALMDLSVAYSVDDAGG